MLSDEKVEKQMKIFLDEIINSIGKEKLTVTEIARKAAKKAGFTLY